MAQDAVVIGILALGVLLSGCSPAAPVIPNYTIVTIVEPRETPKPDESPKGETPKPDETTCKPETKFRGAWYAIYKIKNKKEKKVFVLAIMNENKTTVQVRELEINDGWRYAFSSKKSEITPGEMRIIEFSEITKDGRPLDDPGSCILPVSAILRGPSGREYPLDLPAALPLSIPHELTSCD